MDLPGMQYDGPLVNHDVAPLEFQRSFHDRVVLDLVRQSDNQSRIPLHREPDGLLGVGVAAPGPEPDIIKL